MKQSNIEYAKFLLDQKKGLEHLNYYVTDEDNKLLKGFKVETNDGKTLNVPLQARVEVRKILVRELSKMIKNVDKEIEELD